MVMDHPRQQLQVESSNKASHYYHTADMFLIQVLGTLEERVVCFQFLNLVTVNPAKNAQIHVFNRVKKPTANKPLGINVTHNL